MRLITLLGVGVLALVSGPAAFAQIGFNIDLDLFNSSPTLGSGVPSDAFGAAANQPGRWNRVSLLTTGPVSLVDLNGDPTSVTYSVNAYGGSNTGGGFAFEGNTGDYALLLNDARQVGTVGQGGRNTFRFSGLAPGVYDIVTYAVHPAGVFVNVPVTVWEATENQTQVVTGPMPGNAFEYLVTHSVHRVSILSGGDVHVDIIQPPNQQHAYRINGFQIVAVPEPATWLAMITLSALVLRRRIKQLNQ